jgi:hypothetical protein
MRASGVVTATTLTARQPHPGVGRYRARQADLTGFPGTNAIPWPGDLAGTLVATDHGDHDGSRRARRVGNAQDLSRLNG